MKTYITILCIVVSFTANAQKAVIGLYPSFSNDVANLPYDLRLKNSFYTFGSGAWESTIVQDYNNYSAGVDFTVYFKRKFVLNVYNQYTFQDYTGRINYDQYAPVNMSYIKEEKVEYFNYFASLGIGKVYGVGEMNFFQVVPMINAFVSPQLLSAKGSTSDINQYNYSDDKFDIGLGLSLNIYVRLTNRLGIGLNNPNLVSGKYQLRIEGFATEVKTEKVLYSIGALKNTRIGVSYYIGKNSSQ
jgi:hypothetical protein